MQKKELLELVKREVAVQPHLLGELLKLVADHWGDMVEAQRKERESSHRHALRQMLDNLWSLHLHKRKNPRLFTNMECCTILEAVDAVYPTGKGGCPAETELLDHLAKSFRALGWSPDSTFIKDTMGKAELVRALYENFPERQAAA